MRSALRYEWTRIRTIRSTWWLTGITFVVGVGVSLLIAGATAHEFAIHRVSSDDLDGLGPLVVTQLAATGQVPCLIAFLLAIIGIFAWGHEYRHGMIRASLTALNSRTHFWIAKYAVCAAWVALTSFVVMVVAGYSSELFLHDYLDVMSGQTWQFIGRTVVYTALLTWLGMAFTSVTRSQAFALVALFLWPLLIESLIVLVFTLVPGLRDHRDVTRFLPFLSGGRLLDALSSGSGVFADPMNGLGGLIVFGGTAVVLMVASYLLFNRRDA